MNMKFFHGTKRWLVLSLLGITTLSGCGTSPSNYAVNLEVWGVFDESTVYDSIFTAYQKSDPFVKGIRYRKFDPETYKQELVDALAAGNGPDIFLIQNTWLPDFKNKIAPAADGSISEAQMTGAFPDVVLGDFSEKTQDVGTSKPKFSVYGLPLSVDSLGLYYNKDILSANGIALPPSTWESLTGMLPRLNSIDAYGNINQSAVALGTGQNINRSSDIFLLLLAQYGLNLKGNNLGVRESAAGNALDFYRRFAQAGTGYYSWNTLQHNSVDAFSEGKTAMMLNYSWQIKTIQQKNAKLNFAVVPLPQFAGVAPANIADYWGFVVAKNRLHQPDPSGKSTVDPSVYNVARTGESWQFLRYLTLPPSNGSFTLVNAISGTTKVVPMTIDPAADYIKKTGQPAARRDLIATEQGDVWLGPFASGNLIARSWQWKNPDRVEAAIREMLDSVAHGGMVGKQALQLFDAKLSNELSQ